MPLSTFISRSINSHREALTDICRVIYRILTKRIEVKSISDIISLVNKMNNATEIEWDIDNESSDSEATLTRLMLINNSLK